MTGFYDADKRRDPHLMLLSEKNIARLTNHVQMFLVCHLVSHTINLEVYSTAALKKKLTFLTLL